MRSARFFKFGLGLALFCGLVVAPLVFKKGGVSSLTIFKGVQKAQDALAKATEQQTFFSGVKNRASKREYKKLSSHVYLRGKMVPRNPKGIYEVEGETIFYKDDPNATPDLNGSVPLEVALQEKAQIRKPAMNERQQDWKSFKHPTDILKAAKGIQRATNSRARVLDELIKDH